MPKKDGKGRIAAIEILKATMRTRDYVEKGEGEGKTLLDAMRDGDTEGMQHFDGVIEKYIREGMVDLETGLSFSTNPGNMRLELADYIDDPRGGGAKPAAQKPKETRLTELEVEP
jgi:twitching motility protein PilT